MSIDPMTDPARLLSLPEWIWDPELSPPSALLRAEYGIVPFHGREREIGSLVHWCREERPCGVRLVTGAGGVGKTRLGIELCRRMREAGWQAGFVRRQADDDPIGWVDQVFQLEEPLLIVIDYAETRRSLLVPLLRRAVEHQGSAIRILMLARAALDWWEHLKAEGEGVGDLLASPATTKLSLPPFVTSVEDRLSSFHHSALAFSKILGREQPKRSSHNLEADLFGIPLLLQMGALLSLTESESLRDEDGVLDGILARERRLWKKSLEARDLPPGLARGLSRAMALFTLGGGVASQGKAIEALKGLSIFADQSYSNLAEMTHLLHELYPGESLWIEPLQPDILGEHLIHREMQQGADELFDLVFGPASPPESGPAER